MTERVVLHKIARRLGSCRAINRDLHRVIYELRRELEQAQRDNRDCNERFIALRDASDDFRDSHD